MNKFVLLMCILFVTLSSRAQIHIKGKTTQYGGIIIAGATTDLRVKADANGDYVVDLPKGNQGVLFLDGQPVYVSENGKYNIDIKAKTIKIESVNETNILSFIKQSWREIYEQNDVADITKKYNYLEKKIESIVRNSKLKEVAGYFNAGYGVEKLEKFIANGLLKKDKIISSMLNKANLNSTNLKEFSEYYTQTNYANVYTNVLNAVSDSKMDRFDKIVYILKINDANFKRVYAHKILMIFRHEGYLKGLDKVKPYVLEMNDCTTKKNILDRFKTYAHLREGNQAPDFTMFTENGTAKKLSDFKGKMIVLDAWATW